MLTPEQINNLKNSDKLLVQGEFIKAHDNGSILVSLSTKAWESSIHELLFFHSSSVFLPSEIVNSQSSIVNKYDPTRPYQKGDRARVVERNWRTPTCFPVGRIKVGDIVTVAENEAGDMFIKVLTEDGHEMMVPWFMLELVTPVEEIEPYNVVDAHTHWDVADKDMKTVVTYNKAFHPNAKSAAEAECARLNEEWRKEQK
jgi:hypothetical protein